MVTEAKSCQKNTNAKYCQRETRTEGNGCQADAPLKSFELFFDDATMTETAAWTNQKIENVKTTYTSKPGFLYNTSVTEIRAPIGILLFFGATNNSKVLQAFGLKMVLAS